MDKVRSPNLEIKVGLASGREQPRMTEEQTTVTAHPHRLTWGVHSRARVLVGSGSLSSRVTTSGLNVQTWFVKLSTTDVKLGHRPKSEIRHSTAIYVSALLLKRFPDSQKSHSQRTHLLQMLKYETRCA